MKRCGLARIYMKTVLLVSWGMQSILRDKPGKMAYAEAATPVRTSWISLRLHKKEPYLAQRVHSLSATSQDRGILRQKSCARLRDVASTRINSRLTQLAKHEQRQATAVDTPAKQARRKAKQVKRQAGKQKSGQQQASPPQQQASPPACSQPIVEQ